MVGALCSWPSTTSVHSTSRDTHDTPHTTQGGAIKNLHSLKAFMKFFSDGILDIQICRASMWPSWCFACLGHHISCRNMDILHWKVWCLDTGQTPRWMFGQTINLVLLIETVEALVTGDGGQTEPQRSLLVLRCRLQPAAGILSNIADPTPAKIHFCMQFIFCGGRICRLLWEFTYFGHLFFPDFHWSVY